MAINQNFPSAHKLRGANAEQHKMAAQLEGGEGANMVLVVGNSMAPLSLMRKAAEEIGLVIGEKEGKSTYILNLKNKYYSATLHFTLVSFDDVVSGINVGAVDALIFVVEGSECHTHLPGAGSILLDADPQVLLCVHHKSEEHGASRTLHVEEVQKWCAKNGVEFIDAAVACNVRSKDEDFGAEELGLSRMKQALEANMWPAMTMCTDGGSASGGAAARAPVSLAKEIKSADILPHVEAEGKKGLGHAENEKKISVDGDRDRDLDSENDVEGDAGDVDDFAKYLALIGESFGASGSSGAEADDGLGAAVEQLRSLRAHATTLPDEERRALAAKVAMSFAAMFCGDDDDDFGEFGDGDEDLGM